MRKSPPRNGFSFLVLIAATLAASAASAQDHTPPQVPNTSNDSFKESKRFLEKVVYSLPKHRIDLYCGCRYSEKLQVEFNSCGYAPARNNRRAHRIEWEHVVAAEAFGQSFKEWRDGAPGCSDRKGKHFKGRQCAERVNRQFRLMQADMYNLYPAVGEVNGLRSNYSMAMIPGARYRFGACKTKIENQKIEPRPEVRGLIARTYFYMESAYPGHGILAKANEKLFQAWDKAAPVDAWECERARKIAKAQGNVNQVVETACKAAGL